MTTSAHLIERNTGIVELMIRNRPGIRSFVLGAARTLDLAYAGTTTFLTITQGGSYRSVTLRQKNINRVEETLRGMTRVSYDPGDFASATIPGDPDVGFVRVSEVDSSGATLAEGPILVIPPPGFLGSGRSNLLLTGTAPDVASRGNNLPPTDAMWIDFARFTDNIHIFNDNAGGGDSLFVAFGFGSQEIEIPAATDVEFKDVGASEVLLRGESGTAAFRLAAVLVNGIQG